MMVRQSVAFLFMFLYRVGKRGGVRISLIFSFLFTYKMMREKDLFV